MGRYVGRFSCCGLVRLDALPGDRIIAIFAAAVGGAGMAPEIAAPAQHSPANTQNKGAATGGADGVLRGGWAGFDGAAAIKG